MGEGERRREMERVEGSGALSVCVDIGGTFTDAVLMNGAGAVLASEKVFTTSEDLSSGAIEGVRRLLRSAAVDPAAVGEVVHATTQTSNTVIERTGARTALVTTAGSATSSSSAGSPATTSTTSSSSFPFPSCPGAFASKSTSASARTAGSSAHRTWAPSASLRAISRRRGWRRSPSACSTPT